MALALGWLSSVVFHVGRGVMLNYDFFACPKFGSLHPCDLGFDLNDVRSSSEVPVKVCDGSNDAQQYPRGEPHNHTPVARLAPRWFVVLAAVQGYYIYRSLPIQCNVIRRDRTIA